MKTFMIVDDEEYARLRIHQLMQSHLNYQKIGECSSGIEALEKIRTIKPDLVFIDISMPGKTGLEVAEAFRGENILFVFITAYDEFALRSFESNTLDYLVKPVSAERLAQTLLKFQKRNESTQYIDIVSTQKTIRLEIQKISHIQAEEGYCQIYYEQNVYFSDLTLEEWLQKLSLDGFLQTHKSFLMNKNYFGQINRLGDRKYEIILKNQNRSIVKVGRSFIPELKKYFSF